MSDMQAKQSGKSSLSKKSATRSWVVMSGVLPTNLNLYKLVVIL